MQRMIFVALATGTIAFVTATAWAEEPEQSGPKRGRPRSQPPHRHFEPMQLFERLDAEKAGAITLDKLPERMPERLKEMLAKADADADGKVTREEFKVAIDAARERYAERRKEAMARGRASSGDRAKGAKQEPRKGHPPKSKGCSRPAGPPRRPAMAPPRPPMPDLKSLFARMDRDKSGELSLEEFTEGMRRLRDSMMRRHAHARPPMGPGRRPGPPSWHKGPCRPPRGPDAKPTDAKPREKPAAKPERSRKPKGEKPAEEA